MDIKTCNTCSYFIDDLENGTDCGSINGCIYDKEEQNMYEKIKEALKKEEYDFLRKERHLAGDTLIETKDGILLGSNIIMLGLDGSYAYGTNNEIVILM